MIKTVAAALALTLAVLFGLGAANAAAPQPAGFTIALKIVVEGNQRIEESTVLSYMVVKEGQPYNQAQIDQSLKTLYATGLFSDASRKDLSASVSWSAHVSARSRIAAREPDVVSNSSSRWLRGFSRACIKVGSAPGAAGARECAFRH